ncbi:hypothetical protein [Amycolatopsis sp. H20-H5]|uniref:hypothetical protein n=1 Tax=Amycolatopsis sp. H20-H5 TaxID=3046309 RepID=UPI002DBBA8BB|nr:hypothetical protein [Amycolatopsis sp. H20-H5]MEC3981149.1 hypothetical protein [Amycolatopsis sp. H20-H5]
MTLLSEAGRWAGDSLRRLLGQAPGDFDDGRVALLVCPIDHDLGCAALSARPTFGDGWVGWSDFGGQTDYEPFEPDTPLAADVRFERAAYEALLDDLLRKYAPS